MCGGGLGGGGLGDAPVIRVASCHARRGRLDRHAEAAAACQAAQELADNAAEKAFLTVRMGWSSARCADTVPPAER